MDNKVLATIEFTNGKNINLELYKDIAPITVDNFVELAKSGFYKGLCFHRVIPQFMIQGGGMTQEENSLTEKKAPKTIKGEFSSNGVKNDLTHKKGVISMARTNVMDSASSQFFICVADVPFLDKQYAGFGKVADEESQKVADSIAQVKTGSVGYHDDVPVNAIVIKDIIIK